MVAVDAKLADVPVYLDGVGTARALNTVTVQAQVDGKLLNISFTEGQDVQKGFVLAKIDPTIYQAQYDQAVAKKAQDEATLANARLDLERYIRLSATNAINKQQLDTQKALVNQLEAQVRSDQAAIENARAMLSYTDVVAPIAGRTGIRLIDEGNLVKASDTTGIVVITQLQPISVFFSLPQQVLPELNRGLAEGVLPVAALGADGKTVLDRGKVVVIDNQVDPTTGTVKIKGEFPNDQPAALARAVRQHPAADRHAAPGGGGADGRGPARADRAVRVCGEGRQHGRHAAGHAHQAGRPRGGARHRRPRRRPRGDHGLRPSDRRHPGGGVGAHRMPRPPDAVPTSSVDPPARPKSGNRGRGETQGSGERAKGRTPGGSPGSTP